LASGRGGWGWGAEGEAGIRRHSGEGEGVKGGVKADYQKVEEIE